MQRHDDEDIAPAVRTLIREFAHGIDLPDVLPDDLDLTGDGLGFDSVKVVELILACEERFQVTIPAEELLEGVVVTVGVIVGLVERDHTGFS